MQALQSKKDKRSSLESTHGRVSADRRGGRGRESSKKGGKGKDERASHRQRGQRNDSHRGEGRVEGMRRRREKAKKEGKRVKETGRAKTATADDGWRQPEAAKSLGSTSEMEKRLSTDFVDLERLKKRRNRRQDTREEGRETAAGAVSRAQTVSPF
ncbi:hypothetical protein TGRUB_209780 [Toxoplasma gondii RUB]|uniref:Uncharacterized protein n=1 Tax=Toxoplasma gondii RUB TaxID=935652 RepID=A0A086LUZ6_TOXGO|nr:hypothetical protein TGRUB_209780 [Toxoplasma gondii RUB]